MTSPLRLRRRLLLAALCAVVAACGEPAAPSSPSTPASVSVMVPVPTSSAALVAPSGTSAGSAEPAPTTPNAPLTAGKCKTDADCPPDYRCAQGLPLNGQCWTKSRPAPICLSADTRIDTPLGARIVTELRAGDVVWTVDSAGRRVAAPLVAASHIAVPPSHEMARVTLDDGRSLFVSPGHPTCEVARSADRERTLADLAVGDRYDGALIREAGRAAYGAGATYDVLPAGETGCYWANGVLLGSTLSGGGGQADPRVGDVK